MKRTTLIAAACALLVVTTGFAAAAPGNAPATVDANSSDAEQHATNHDARQANDSEPRNESRPAAGAAENQGERGPAVDLPAQVPDAVSDRIPENPVDRVPADLPTQVPDHVSEIHDRISSFLEGDLTDSLGDAVSEVVPGGQGDESADDHSDDGTQQSAASGDAEADGAAESPETDGQTA
ncbi:hypothetical protein [Natrinema sp. 74]|uniref:hypothetical protein n=1 Tax=Natrinema sp. 74 TaxID=3384159 RepID=UPI0038D3C989